MASAKSRQRSRKFTFPDEFSLFDVQAKEVMRETPEKVIEAAVYGMLPKNVLRKQRMKNLTIQAGSEESIPPNVGA